MVCTEYRCRINLYLPSFTTDHSTQKIAVVNYLEISEAADDESINEKGGIFRLSS